MNHEHRRRFRVFKSPLDVFYIVLSGCEGFVSMVLLHGPTSLPSP